MAIEDIKNREEWENFFLAIERRTFLNSWEWGEFRKSLGDKIWRKGVVGKEGTNLLFLASKVKSRKGDFILLLHSPVMKKYSRSDFAEVIEEVKKIAKTEKVDFIRIVPIFAGGSEEEASLKDLGFKESPSSIFFTKSLELNLGQTEEQLFAGMRKGTRYLIRKGLKNKDIEIFTSIDKKELEIFCDLQNKTAQRQGFTPFATEYIRKELEIFSKNDQAKLFLGFHKGKCIAGAFIVFWGKKAFCHHAVSILTPNKIPVSHLVQWEVIKEAKKKGCLIYDFWAISPSDSTKHKWDGLTFFKKGFGGKEINYAKVRDLPLSKKYLLTYWVEKLRG